MKLQESDARPIDVKAEEIRASCASRGPLRSIQTGAGIAPPIDRRSDCWPGEAWWLASKAAHAARDASLDLTLRAPQTSEREIVE
jgi:hypothetical protein